MPPQIATLLFVIGILGLFSLNRDREARTSKALWIPVVWLSIAASRAVSQWLEVFGLNSGTHPFDSMSADQILDGSPLDRDVFIGLLALGLIVLFTRRQKVGALLRANGPILLFLFYCAVSVVWSDYPDVAFKRWIKALGDVVMVIIVLTDPDETTAIKRFFTRVGFVLVPLSVLFVRYYPDLGRSYDRFSYMPFYNGVTTGKNLLGMTCLIMGIAGVWQFLLALRRRDGKRATGPLVAQAVLLAMAFYLFYIANSMTSLSCFLMAAGLIVATNLRFVARRQWVVHALILVILSVSVSALFLNVGGAALETMGRNSTLTGRTDIWDLVLKMTGNPIIGTGFESFWLGKRLQDIWNLYWWHPNEAHNGYLEVYLNLGWVGVTLFVIVLLTGYRNVMRAFRRDPDLGRLKMAYFVAALAYNLTESAVRTVNPVWIALLLAIMAVPETTPPEGQPSLGDTEDAAKTEPQHAQLVGAKLRQVRA
jgi:exopolysaccharide production protein ExoQ